MVLQPVYKFKGLSMWADDDDECDDPIGKDEKRHWSKSDFRCV